MSSFEFDREMQALLSGYEIKEVGLPEAGDLRTTHQRLVEEVEQIFKNDGWERRVRHVGGLKDSLKPKYPILRHCKELDIVSHVQGVESGHMLIELIFDGYKLTYTATTNGEIFDGLRMLSANMPEDK